MLNDGYYSASFVTEGINNTSMILKTVETNTTSHWGKLEKI
jgi:hypothetical protein